MNGVGELKLLETNRTIANRLAVLVGIAICTAVAVMFLSIRESDGIKALAEVQAQRSLIDAQRALIESYSVNQINADNRIRVLEQRITSLHRDLLKNRFPVADESLITDLLELYDVRHRERLAEVD